MEKKIISAVGSDIIYKHLGQKGYNVTEDIAYQEETLNIIKNELADVLILSSLIEGEDDTYIFIKKIREIDKKIKIILILNTENEIDSSLLQEAGVYEVLIDRKFSVEDIEDRINKQYVPQEDLQKEILTLKNKLQEKSKQVNNTNLIPKFQKQEIIAIAGTEGAGKSTFTAQLSTLIAEKSKSKVLVIDFDTVNGFLNQYLLMQSVPEKPEYLMPKEKSSSLNYIVDAIDKRNFDISIFEKYLIKSKKIPNLEFLSGNNSLYVCKSVLNNEYYIRILEKAKQLYDFIIIDTSSNIFLDSTQFALNNSTKIFFITEGNNVALTKTNRIISEVYKAWEIKNEKIKIIINKFDEGSLEKPVIEEILKGFQIEGYIRYAIWYSEFLNKKIMHIPKIGKEEYMKIAENFDFMPKLSIKEKIKRRVLC